jgi:phenylacetate-coenzyme A ligase PaaK-like adenylate-forming protein
MPELRDTQLEMLKDTLRHAAATTKYYAETLAPLDLNLRSIDELARLPLLKRDVRAQRTLDLLTEGVTPEYVNVTSGTTFAGRKAGPPLLHYHDTQEHDAANLLREAAYAGTSERPLIIKLLSGNHGLTVSGAQPGTFAMPLEKRFHLQAIRHVLTQSFAFKGFTPRVQALSGTLNMLKLLTLLFIEEGVPASDFDVRMVSTQSWHLTDRWAELLQGYWQVPVDDAYGMSEVPGFFARRCRECRRFHLSECAIVETLGVQDDNPVEEGYARLVVTSLLPLAHAQPTIRYDTDDVVWLARCPKTGERSCQLLGRRRDIVLLDDSPEPLLTPLGLHTLMDDLPELAQHQNPRAEIVGLKTSFGWPKYRVVEQAVEGIKEIRLQMELRFSPRLYRERAEQLRDSLTASVLTAFPALARAQAKQRARLVIDFAEPGSTDYATLI